MTYAVVRSQPVPDDENSRVKRHNVCGNSTAGVVSRHDDAPPRPTLDLVIL